eukprot:TRINITY_DN3123_c0_g1_i12.p4 TRINITY_DN3123_c0_g1~~TRINITY_DN3123_c0_g1_i12.p4  ORF type:complete len:150 (+),score=34.28 TRINITY_DN3123_c0_g1_i12:146-595(+)
MELTLITQDHKELPVDYDTIVQYSSTIKNVFEDTEDERIPIQRVNKATLDLVLEYINICEQNKNQSEEKKEQELQNWSDSFGAQQLYDMVMAANFLVIDSLLDHICDVIAEKYVRGRPIEDIRATFGIVNDLTPEEEEEIQRANYEWSE